MTMTCIVSVSRGQEHYESVMEILSVKYSPRPAEALASFCFNVVVSVMRSSLFALCSMQMNKTDTVPT